MEAGIALARTSLLIGGAQAPDDTGGLELDEADRPSICGSKNDAQHINNYNCALATKA